MTYFETFDTFETDESLTGCCCCDATTTEVWTEPAPIAETEVYATEATWAPEAPAYEAPSYEVPAYEAPEPIYQAQAEAPAVSDLSGSMTIGGIDPYGDFTIVNPDGTPADLGPSTMTIGGPSIATSGLVDQPAFSPSTMTIGGVEPLGPSGVDTTANSLATIYGVAAQNGDIMSQLMIQNIMASQNAAIRVWTMPDVVVL